jgi:cytochrome c oxidase assembly protein subunit 15
MTRFQRLALTAYICVEALLFVGAAVRASGSGLGCPDWPFCYGCWMPPTTAADIDFNKLDLAKFRAKAARLGRDPSTITVESLRASFDPVATWVEYLNRLTSLPVGVSVLILMVASVVTCPMTRREKSVVAAVLSFLAALIYIKFGAIEMLFAIAISLIVVTVASALALPRKIPVISFSSTAALLFVLINAWLGARVVLSGLKPGTITVHMALAILLLCVLVYTAWRGTETPWSVAAPGQAFRRGRMIAFVLFGLVVMEGIMGSQVREMTDELAMRHAGEQRALWVAELEQTWVYLIHRSFSWLLLGCAAGFAALIRKAQGRLRWLEKGIVVLVVAQMVLGVILAHAGILRVVQILHIGLSSVLVSGLFLWLLASRPLAVRTGVIEEVH